MKRYAAEVLGTFILVFGGTMAIKSAFSGLFGGGSAPQLAIAFGFGLSVLAAIYAVGAISGAHLNPAVTLGVFLNGGIGAAEVVGYWVSQVVGATLAAAGTWWITGDNKVGLQGEDFGNFENGAAAALIGEMLLTAVFVYVILGVTHKTGHAAKGFDGLAIGLTLVAVHLAGIPYTGASVNPARSLGPAILGASGGAWQSIWVYIIGPMAGAVVAAALHRFTHAGATTETVVVSA